MTDVIGKYKVSYKVEVIQENTTILCDGFSCISFENQGNNMAYLNDVAVLPPFSQIKRFFNEDPENKIDSYFNITFADNSDVYNNVLVIKSYYTPNTDLN